jgi:hypothetical protein
MKRGYYSNQCPDCDVGSRTSPAPGPPGGFAFSQHQGNDVSNTWLPLDNQCTSRSFVKISDFIFVQTKRIVLIGHLGLKAEFWIEQ